MVSIAGGSVDEYVKLAQKLRLSAAVSAVEVNISCPNVESGLEFGVDPRAAGEVTNAVRRQTGLPLIVKLTPNVNDIVTVAQAVVDAGADAVGLINTYPAMKIDVRTRKPALSL